MKGPAEVAHGPMFIGFTFNVLLYGVMITQVYLYFTTYKKDKAWMKVFVLVLFVADTANTIFVLVYLYNSLIIHFGDIPFLMRADWVFATDPALTGIIASLVQLFFAWRVKVLTANIWLVTLVILSALAGGIGGVATAIEVGITPNFVDFRDFKAVVIIWLAAECLGDILITTILVWHLRKHKTGFQASDELVDRIIRMTVQTGMITAFCASLDMIFFLVDPTGTHLILNLPLSKLYSNSLMSSLNSRRGWSYSTRQNGATLRSLTSTEQRKPADAAQLVGARPEVFVHVESHESRDAGSKTGSRIYMSESISDPRTSHDDSALSIGGKREGFEQHPGPNHRDQMV